MAGENKGVMRCGPLVVSGIAVAVSVFAVVQSRRAEQRAYERVVGDCWRELGPALADMDFKVDPSEPRTVAELARRIKPVFEPVFEPVTGDAPGGVP